MGAELSFFNWGAFLLVVLITSCIGGVAFLTLWSLGYFQEAHVQVCSPTFGRLTVAYKYAKDHSKMELIRRSQRAEPLHGFKTIVVHYGENFKLQASMDHSKSYAVGVILSEDGILPALPVIHYLTSQGYKIAVFPKISHAILAAYTYKFTVDNHLCLSRVYPKLLALIFQRRLCAHPAVEIYDHKTKTVTFMLPLARQVDFYVPEIVQEIYGFKS